MTAPAAIPAQILAANVDGCTLIAVIGPANFRLATTFRQALQAAKLAGSRLIVVDMAQCAYLDSTFMGTLAALGLSTQQPDGIPAVLINLTPQAGKLLRGLGIHRLIKAYPADQLPPDLQDLSGLVNNLQPVDTPETSRHDMAALLYDAHETLTRVTPENIQKFKNVLTYLQQDLQTAKPQ